MTFDEVLGQIRELLATKGRATYRALKVRFDLTDELLAACAEELIEAERVAVDENGKMLVWVGTRGNGETEKGINGQGSPASRVQSLESQTSPSSDPRRQTLDPRPITYTPPHLAERIRAVTVNAGERKTITALFADLKGSTALIEGLDPEEAQRVIDPALQLMMDAVHQYEGFVAQPLGDGIFALFGAPLAHEDHPQRALYAALRMQETMRRYADSLRQKGHPPLLMRVGLNTGEVVLRSIRKDDLRADYVPVGHSTNLAARMEQLATPGTIVVSAYTHRLTDGYFAFKDLGPTQIKGVADALHIYELLGVGQLRTRLQVSASRYGLTRFVGRHREMEQLNQALAHAKAGHGQIVGTMGEPGLGQSRLFYEFKLLSLGGCLVLEAYSVSHGKATAYLPVIELLKSYFEIKSEDDERKRREKVLGKVLGLDRSLEETMPYLFALLGIEEQPSPLQQMDPQIRRRRTFEALKKLFLRESLNQPLILIFEDLHWIDGETQGFLDVLSESLASAKLLLLTNYRPEYRHEWGQKTYYTQLRLAPFGKDEAEEFLDVLLGQAPLPTGERARVRGMENDFQALKHLTLDKTQGTPFFMEEIVQDLFEQGVLVRTEVGAVRRDRPSAETLHIPPTVQAVLAARIDRLAADEKALLQQLAVIGRQFPLSLVRQVVTEPEAELYRLLASLQHKEFLYEQPAVPESEYIFKHALTQEVAYGTVLQEQKKVLHERTGQAIEQLYKDKLEEHYDELAHHYQRSGNAEKAVEYLQKVGQQAVRRSANEEAVVHYTAALALLTLCSDNPDRSQTELQLQLALAVPLAITRGYAAPEVGVAYQRARELCQHLENSPQLLPVLLGLRRFYLSRAEHRTAGELAEQLFTVAQRLRDLAFLPEGHRAVGMARYLGGEFAQARRYCEEAIALYAPHLHRGHVFLYGQDPKAFALSTLAWSLWALGYPDQARQRVREALSLAQDLFHPLSVAMALTHAALLHQCCREVQASYERAEAIIALCSEQRLPYWLETGIVLRGWALAEQGREGEGMAEMRRGLAAYRTVDIEQGKPHLLAMVAEVEGKVGQIEEGLALVAEALAFIDRTEERYYEAELYRLKGELLLRQAEKLRE